MKITEILDIVIACLFLFSVIVGYHRGLVLTVFRVVSMVAAYIGARALAVLSSRILGQSVVLPWLEHRAGTGAASELVETAIADAAEGVAYSLVFCVAFFALEIVLLRLASGWKIVDYIPVVGTLNKLGGAAVGFLWSFVLLLLVGNIFFTYIPKEMQRQMGFTNRAVQETVLLNVFVP